MTVPKLDETFAVLAPDLAVHPIPLTPGIYAELDRRFDAFRGHVLVAVHAFAGDWPTWERHPAGDEIVVLLSGAATLLLRGRDGDEAKCLDEPGQYVVVPRGTWHTARVTGPTRMLFITPGEGTENVEAPPGD